MKVEVEVISKEIIKPSSPTPNHLRRYPFSFLDQTNHPIYASLVFFYESYGDTQSTIAKISKHLKKSLADVLTIYYPLAGKIRLDEHFVDCNDEGIPYFEAQVTNCRLSDFVQNPVPGELYKFAPFRSFDIANAHEFPVGIQLNIFECGGFAIGVSATHKIADGLSILSFIKSFATTARGEHNQLQKERPQFVSAALFPPRKLNPFDGHGASLGIKKTTVTKRFVFSPSTIEDLIKKYTCLSEADVIMKRPVTRLEALSAFLWRRFVEATKDDAGRDNNLHRVINAVNLRPRINPQLPSNAYGNIFRLAITDPFLSSDAISSWDDEDHESCYGMVRRVQEAVGKIDKNYVKRLQQGDEDMSFVKPLAQSFSLGHELVTSNYTSLCKFPLYENDFGWGRPMWVALSPMPLDNLTAFLDTKEPGGIEAYVNLEEHVMTKFDSDPFLQRRVGPSICPIVGNFHTRNRLGSTSVLFGSCLKLMKAYRL